MHYGLKATLTVGHVDNAQDMAHGDDFKRPLVLLLKVGPCLQAQIVRLQVTTDLSVLTSPLQRLVHWNLRWVSFQEH